MISIREDVFRYYFYFVQERMNIFWRKCKGQKQPWTNDAIFRTYKFTNVYRATDRVSQYLISDVIYKNDPSLNERDIIFRILFFKIFNKIETWDYIERKLGTLKIDTFDLPKINRLLTQRKEKTPIFNNAYMMTGTHSKYNNLEYKHEKWLQMLMNEVIHKKVIEKIITAKSLEEVYLILRNCSFMGDFIAYQYTIDLNYSQVINFSEDSFVKAGIGSIRGIKKCFQSLGNNSFEDAIRYTHDNFERLQNKFGYNEFNNLFGRKPTLIDIQNCFCETDKYLRAKLPELQIDNIRIKQKYSQNGKPINLFFPPKWNINSQIEKTCSQQSTKALTLF